ncbi:MAG TPA: protein kinase [Gemmatimonadaceae bacterium]|nr:protein kinase [Gemmatimonadaceae bacterium]
MRFDKSGHFGAPSRTRTCDPRLRSPRFYPSELRAHDGKRWRLNTSRLLVSNPGLPADSRYDSALPSTLSPGTRLGPYEILSDLGAGGMGEVYRARDTKLNRDVAIKVLPEVFTHSPDRVARFTREAQTLASLNHPNIAQIYGIENNALVMELVAGEDLSAIIARGPIPLTEALPIARQIADALEAAHDQGIIHRDLKPANIKVRADGTVKVLDFGLAKVMDQMTPDGDAMQSPTFTSPALSRMGVILGTAAYMAPEQARGKAVDRRADIWAFGVVMFEMLTGGQTFGGETITDVLAAVVKESPDWTLLPAATPPALRRLLVRCLEKDPKRRMRDAGDARMEIEDLLSGVPAAATSATPAPAPARASHGRLLITAVVIIAVAAAAAAAGWMLKPARELPLRKFAIGPKDGARVVDAAISPDGRAVVFLANEKTWVQRLDSVTPTEMIGVTDVHALFWSPDSTLIGFQSKGQLWKVPAAGGTPSPICRVEREFSGSGGADWLPDDRIVFTTGGSGLMEVSARGGQPRVLLAPDLKAESDLHQVFALPQGKGFLFVPHLINKPGLRIDLFNGSARTTLFSSDRGLSYPVYAPSGHLLFTQESAVWAVKYSLAEGKVSGTPFLVSPTGTRPTVADDGTIAIVTDEASAETMQVSWVDRSGALVSPVGRVGRLLNGLALSPDGSRVVGHSPGSTSASADLWVIDLDRHRERRLTYEDGRNTGPHWSPDGKYIVYACQAGVCSRPADGTGQPLVLVPAPAHSPVISPDGSALLYTQEQAVTAMDIFAVALGPKAVAALPVGQPRPLVAAERTQRAIEVSPDGKYGAYSSNETGVYVVYLTEFPSGRGKWQVGTGGLPRWNGKGDRLYIDVGDRLMEVEITTSPALSISEPRALFSAQTLGIRIPAGYQPSADGSRFLVNRSVTAASSTAVTIVQNWFAEFAVGAKR